jgi:hypothetical protein
MDYIISVGEFHAELNRAPTPSGADIPLRDDQSLLAAYSAGDNSSRCSLASANESEKRVRPSAVVLLVSRDF